MNRRVIPSLAALLAFASTGCADLQRATAPAPAQPAGPSSIIYPSDCLIYEIAYLSPSNASVLVGSSRAFDASVSGARRGDGSPCTVTEPVWFSWTVSDATVAQIGSTYTSGSLGNAAVQGLAPGTVQITVTASTPSLQASTTRSRATSLTVVARTPTPVLSGITGPSSVGGSGTYTYTVTASGGNGSTYNYVWETRHSGLSWQTAYTSSGGPTSSAPIPIVGGRLYSVRVRVTSGNSYEAVSAEYTVDARGAASPLGVEISGSDNIRYTGTHTFEAMPTGGASTAYTYYWTLRRPDNSVVHGTNKTFSVNFSTCEGPDGYDLEVAVTSGAETASAGTVLNVEIYNC